MSFLNMISNKLSSIVQSFNPTKGDAEAAIRAFAMVAAADGELQAEEATKVVAYIQSFDWIRSYGSDEECESLFMQVVNKIIDAPTPTVGRMIMSGEAQKLQKLVRKGGQNAKTIYELCMEMAADDNGKVEESEHQVLNVLKSNLGA